MLRRFKFCSPFNYCQWLATRFLLLVCVLLISCHPSRAEDSVEVAVKNILDQIQPYLKEKRLFAINVGGFTSIAGTSAGPEIQFKLSKAIEEIDRFKVDRIDYDAKVTGRIELREFDNGGFSVRIVAQLFDANNQPLVQFSGESEVSADVLGQEAVPRLLGISSNLKTNDTKSRDKQLKQDFLRDPSIIQGTKVFSAEDSPYSIELLVKKGDAYIPIAPKKSGRKQNAFGFIPRGSIFAVRLNNHSNQEVVVNLTLDGINSFAFSKVRAETVYWLVPASRNGQPGQTMIRGWDIDNQTSQEFKTVGYPESAAKKLKIEPNEAMGQICAQFSKSLPLKPGSRGRSVGFGDTIQDIKKSVPRDIGELEATIQLRYER